MLFQVERLERANPRRSPSDLPVCFEYLALSLSLSVPLSLSRLLQRTTKLEPCSSSWVNGCAMGIGYAGYAVCHHREVDHHHMAALYQILCSVPGRVNLIGWMRRHASM